ncbi:response regulator [Bremerella alba]|nr:response regulator [Bremerella alba]
MPIYGAIFFSIAGVFLIDLFTPLGIAVWIFYLVPVVLTLLVWRPQIPLYVASVLTLLMVITFFTDSSGVDLIIVQINRGFGALTVWCIAIVAFFFLKNKNAIEFERWLQKGQTGLSKTLSGDQRIEQLGNNLLRYLAEYFEAPVAACFAIEGEHYRRIATYGVPAESGLPEQIEVGDGLLGQAIEDQRPFVLTDVPEGHLLFGTGLTRGTPSQMIISPAIADDEVQAVVELGFFRPIDHGDQVLLSRISEAVGQAIRSANYRAKLQKLLHETQQQSEELQTQSEELRVSNEELEEQGRALKETAARLELQQTELEQTNSQLEEQTQLLEAQRDELAVTKLSLQQQAKDLERASQYKSDFLANMSHELRTPLNSTLILAKLLADNASGNLTEEQIKFAKTILSSGNDLLNLISDILDLSKIEAGQMDVRPEEVKMGHLLDELSNGLRPLAEQKQLKFSIEVKSNAPSVLWTDRRRLEQILKNLASNAIKFTNDGSVTIHVSKLPERKVAFAVQDTGIGIPLEQQPTVFEAFRQVDGTAHRKHGGTGLGLSISQELANLLGGEIALESEVGKGSLFTLTVPATFEPSQIETSPVRKVLAASLPSHDTPSPDTLPTKSDPPFPKVEVKDDRRQLSGDRRLLLVVEDDLNFGEVLYGLAREQKFDCLLATTAEEGVTLAKQYQPNAIILDVGLPDDSGLAVLDSFKGDARLRHIPVHVISGNDYTESALSLGAVGFKLKPVRREEFIELLQGLESRFSQRMRRVLVVEDDPVQRESVQSLLGSLDVETVGSANAAECLEQLKEGTFDCMVLDLALPDSTGYALLETLSKEDHYSFPPVIVYTGRDLSADQEQLLRQYSQSIIIKGAKSPERLMDEVTLFLHKVVAELPLEQQRMIEKARRRDEILEGRRILVVEDDVRNVFALTSVLEPRGAVIEIARNGREAVDVIEKSIADPTKKFDLVLMDVMMPEMDGITATQEIRKHAQCKRLAIIMLTAKAMENDQKACLEAGANDYLTKPLDVDKLLSLIRVWLPR